MATNRERRARREAEAARRRADATRARRRRTLTTAAVAVVAVLVVVGVAFVALRGGDDGPVGPSTPPSGVTADGGVTDGSASAPVDVVVYEDFRCEFCEQLESDAGDYLDEQAAAGAVQVEYRPIAILGDESELALSAAACVVDAGGRPAFLDFHDRVFADGFDDADTLVGYAADAGAGGAATAGCITEESYDGWTAATTDAARDAGVEGTPTVLVDGEQLDEPTLDSLTAAVEAAG